MTGFEEQDTDLFLCDTNTCKFDGECLRIGDTVTCICDFKVGISAPHTFASFISTTCWRCDIVKGITTRGVNKLSQIKINLHMPSHKKHAHILSLGHGQRAPLVLRHRASVSCCRPSCITQANSIICLLAQCTGGGEFPLMHLLDRQPRSAQRCLVHLRRVTLLSFLPLIQLSGTNASLGPRECLLLWWGGLSVKYHAQRETVPGVCVGMPYSCGWTLLPRALPCLQTPKHR